MVDQVSRYENFEESLVYAIRNSDKTYKEIAAKLWPADRFETSYQRLLDALNPSKKQKLSMQEVIFICNYCDRYDPLYYFADETLHDRPKKKLPEVKLQELHRTLEETMSAVLKIYQKVQYEIKKYDEIQILKEKCIDNKKDTNVYRIREMQSKSK